LECGDMLPLFDTATCRGVPKRGHVHALQTPGVVGRQAWKHGLAALDNPWDRVE